MPPTPAEIAKAFQMFDTDSDGSLSPAELKAVLCRPVKGATALTEAQVDDLIKKFDKNGDGVLDLDEFVEAWGSWPHPDPQPTPDYPTPEQGDPQPNPDYPTPEQGDPLRADSAARVHRHGTGSRRPPPIGEGAPPSARGGCGSGGSGG